MEVPHISLVWSLEKKKKESFDQKWVPKAKLRSIFIMETFPCPPTVIIDLNDVTAQKSSDLVWKKKIFRLEECLIYEMNSKNHACYVSRQKF